MRAADCSRSAEAGFVDYVVKGSPPEVLVAAIEPAAGAENPAAVPLVLQPEATRSIAAAQPQ